MLYISVLMFRATPEAAEAVRLAVRPNTRARATQPIMIHAVETLSLIHIYVCLDIQNVIGIHILQSIVSLDQEDVDLVGVNSLEFASL